MVSVDVYSLLHRHRPGVRQNTIMVKAYDASKLHCGGREAERGDTGMKRIKDTPFKGNHLVTYLLQAGPTPNLPLLPSNTIKL